MPMGSNTENVELVGTVMNITTWCLNLLLLGFIVFAGCRKSSNSSTPPADPAPGDWISSFSTISSSVSNATSLSGVYNGKDASGNFYLSGSTNDGWLVMISSDEGASWSPDSLVSGATNVGYQIVGNSRGDVFNVGQSGSNGVIRKRDRSTHTWSTVYSGQINSGYNTAFYGVAVNSADEIFVIGSAFLHLPSVDVWPDTGLNEWVILKSTNHGVSWTTINAYYPSDQSTASPRGILVTASGNLYAYGSTGSTRSSMVRKSTDSGATWTTIFEDTNCVIRGMAEWNSGLVISEEYYPGGAGIGRMRVRGTTDDFAHLKTLDEYNPAGAAEISTAAIQADSRNYLYYSGYWLDGSNIPHLILRIDRGDGVWTTLDDFTTDITQVGDVFFNSTTGVFSVGVTSTSWVLRNATVNTATAFTPGSMANGTDFTSPLPAGTKRIFTTWRRHDGNFGASATAAMAAADNFCNTDPRKPVWNPSANYKAMLVSSVRRACSSANCAISGVAEHLDWVFASSTTYVSYEGKTILTTNANGIFTSMTRSPITISVDYAWTGLNTAIDWTTDTSNNVCGDWTTNNGDGSDWSTAWDLHGPSFVDIYVNYTPYCDASMPLICVEQ